MNGAVQRTQDRINFFYCCDQFSQACIRTFKVQNQLIHLGLQRRNAVKTDGSQTGLQICISRNVCCGQVDGIATIHLKRHAGTDELECTGIVQKSLQCIQLAACYLQGEFASTYQADDGVGTLELSQVENNSGHDVEPFSCCIDVVRSEVHGACTNLDGADATAHDRALIYYQAVVRIGTVASCAVKDERQRVACVGDAGGVN